MYAAWSGFPHCAYADDIPGFGSLVGREFQSLATRLLVSALRGMRDTHNLDYILFYNYDNLRNVYNVFSTVINDASLGCY